MGGPNRSVNCLLFDEEMGCFSGTDNVVDDELVVIDCCVLFNDLSLDGITPDVLDLLVSLPVMLDLLYLVELLVDVCCFSSLLLVVDLVVATLDSLVTYKHKENIQLN